MNQMRIINGRCFGDIFGNYTCHNYHGSSVVDYLLSDEEIINCILFFLSVWFHVYIVWLPLYAILEYICPI